MTPKLKAREKFLLGVLILAGVLLVYYYMGGESPFGTASEETVDTGPPVGDAPVVRMDLLALAAEGYDPRGRNLFTYYVPPRAPVKRPPPQPRKTITRPPPPPPKSKVKRGPTKPKAPAPDFKYIGYIGPKDRLIAYFEGDFGEEPLGSATVGEVIKDTFTLLEFKHETVVLGYVDERFSGETAELKLQAN